MVRRYCLGCGEHVPVNVHGDMVQHFFPPSLIYPNRKVRCGASGSKSYKSSPPVARQHTAVKNDG